MLRARDERQALAVAIERQRLENRRLREEARRLAEDPSAIEEIARRELGLIRPGEKVFILRDLSPTAARP
jgi:cell division protein FtsB